jgi:hypothetical protein
MFKTLSLFCLLPLKIFSLKEFVPNLVPLLHIVPFCKGPNKKLEGFAKEKQKT